MLNKINFFLNQSHIFINFSLFITSMILILKYIITNSFHLFINNGIYIKLFYSYLIISILLVIYFFIKYFVELFYLKLIKKLNLLMFIIIFLSVIFVSFLIAINIDLNKINFIKNITEIGFSIFILFFLIIGLTAFIKLSKPSKYLNELNPQIIKKYNISKKEIEIIKQLVLGKTNKEISDTLFISLSTVKTHIYNIFQKTNVKKRIEIINLFFKSI
jgi:DNA-binding CsgD family transcriptional regulator